MEQEPGYTVLSRDTYQLVGEGLGYYKIHVSQTWNLLVEKQRINLRGWPSDDAIPPDVLVTYGGLSPIRFTTTPDLRDHSYWSSPEHRSVDGLIVSSLRAYVDDIDSWVGPVVELAAITKRTKEAAGSKVSPKMVELWRGIVSATTLLKQIDKR